MFDSERGGAADDVGDRTAEDSAASKERMLLMGRIGRGEISLEDAKAIYGEDLLGITSPATPLVVAEESELESSEGSQAPAE